MRLKRDFYRRDVREVAQDLLGKVIVRQFPKGELRGMIVETEAYGGEEDGASHARFGKTERSKVMYGKPGLVYVYLIYGMYWMLNMVTGKEGEPQAVLIRDVKWWDPTSAKADRRAGGPGKVGRALKLDKSFYGEDLTESERIWVEDAGIRVRESEIQRTPRIGVEYAGEWAKKKWRYVTLTD